MSDLLWTPPTGVGLLKHHAGEKTVTLKNGKRAKITVDDSGTVMQIECGDRLDAIVRPRTVRVFGAGKGTGHGHR